jgi:MFS family permease
MRPPTERPPATFLCALLNAVGGGLGWSIVPPLLPQIGAELHLNTAMTGIIWGATPLGIALSAPIGGALVDRFGARRVAGLAMLLGAAACALRAAATGPWSLAAAMLLFGTHIGGVAPAIPKALAGHVPASRLIRANGIALLAYTLTTALTVLTARTVLAPLAGGWRPLMIAAGAAMAATSAIWLLLYRDAHAPGAAPRHAALQHVFRAARDADVRRLAGAHFLLFGGYLALLGLLPRALIQGGIAPAHVAAIIAGWLLVAAIANGAGPWLSDRIGRRRPFLVGGAIVAGAALLLLSLLPAHAAPFLLPVAALGGGCVAPLLLALPVELPSVGPARAGTVLGLLMLVGQLGGFLLPILAGVAGRHALLVLAAAHLLVILPALTLRETATPRQVVA